MKKIILYTIPAVGHINAMLSMMEALCQKGYQLYVYSTKRFQPIIEETGASFLPYDIDDSKIDLRDGSRLLKFQRLLLQYTLHMMDTLLETANNLSPDLIIHDSAAHWGLRVAQKLQRPGVAFCSFIAIDKAFHKSYFAYCKNFSLKFLLDCNQIPAIFQYQRALKRSYGFRGLGLLDVCLSHQPLHIISYSKLMQPGYESFSEDYFFLGPACTQRQAQADDISYGKANNIYVSLGTIMGGNKLFYETLANALGNTKYTVYISDHSKTANKIKNLPTNFVVRPYFNQAKALAHASAFITAGGVNSLSEAIYHKTPCLVYPQQGEQKISCASVCKLGFGKRYQPHRPMLPQIEQTIALRKTISLETANAICAIKMDELLDKIQQQMEE